MIWSVAVDTSNQRWSAFRRRSVSLRNYRRKIGDPGRIRTCDFLLRRQSQYRSDVFVSVRMCAVMLGCA